jgi:hypothetical protein
MIPVLLAGCVYGPPYYEDPFSPPPWPHSAELCPPRGYYLQRQPDPWFQRRRHADERYYRRYRPDIDPQAPSTAPGGAGTETPIPPSKVEVPDPGKGSPSKPDTSEVPTATRGSKPGRVKLPFPPYSELDVSGMPSGSLARDPTSGKVFRIP